MTEYSDYDYHYAIGYSAGWSGHDPDDIDAEWLADWEWAARMDGYKDGDFDWEEGYDYALGY